MLGQGLPGCWRCQPSKGCWLLAAGRAEAACAQSGDAVRQCCALYLQYTLMCRAEPLADRRRLRQNANRLGMWLMMLAQSGETQATRLALPEAMQFLERAGRRGMLLLPLAWLAGYEDRLQSATALLARFDAAGGTGREFAPGTYIRRSVDSLWGRLQLKCGAQRLARARDAALDNSDDEAVVAATGTAGDGSVFTSTDAHGSLPS